THPAPVEPPRPWRGDRTGQPRRPRPAPSTPHRPRAGGGAHRSLAPSTAPSIADEEEVDATPAQPGLANQQVKAEASQGVSNRIERDVLLMMQNLYIRPALVTAFGLDRSWAAFDFLIGDALGRPTDAAFGTDVVPLRGTQRAGAEPCASRALPVDHHRGCR